MKKLSALLLALVLAVTLCLGAMAEEVNYVGAWTLTEIRSGELVMDPATLGMDMAIVLNEDGTCTLSTLGVTETGTWAAVEGGVALTDASGTTDTVTYRDGALVMASEGIEMILTPAAEGEYAEILAGQTMENFAGNWVLEHEETTYGVYSVEALGAEMTVVITGTDAVIEMVTTSGAMTFNAICETEEADGLGTIMWASFLDDNGEPDGTSMMFLLYDDGQLVWYEYDSTEGQECEYFYCFTNTAE
ncbi:MAG: hypothetical protein IKK57_03940 [Clostridia bacterium]|nr:hypothetical protein [Clostridia bacterium]